MPSVDASPQRCLERQPVSLEGWRPHVCVESLEHLVLGVPHRCTCGFTWWRTVLV